jgi:Ran GTPase-activating protein (RanGAP) involved in mRNA processing and transport
MIRCSGNSYSFDACEYIAEIIKEKGSSTDFYHADFSNMFAEREFEEIPPSIQ